MVWTGWPVELSLAPISDVTLSALGGRIQIADQVVHVLKPKALVANAQIVAHLLSFNLI